MLRVVFALWFGMAGALLSPAQPMPEAAAQMASRISSLPPHRATVSLEFQNLSSLTATEAASFRDVLEQELRRAGTEVSTATAATGQSESRLRVAISENIRGLLFVATLGADDNRQIAMLPWSAPPPAPQKLRVKLAIQTLHEQPEPILDFLLLDSGSQMLILGASKISSYKLVNGQWNLNGVVNVPLARPLPRDSRGHMTADATALHVYFAGTTCVGVASPDLKLSCVPGNESWLVNRRDPTLAVRWINDRNLLESEGAKEPFYSAAAGWFAMPGGGIENRAGDKLRNAEGWGSDIASIENPCGSGALMLSTSAGDGASNDRALAYTIADNEAIAQSDPIGLTGTEVSLWPAETPALANVVVRNSKTGNYEASRLGLACAQ